MPHDLKKSVMDVIKACRLIQEFTAGHTLEMYNSDEMRRSAVERQFGIIGEAFNRIKKVDPLFDDVIPEFRKIIGMRNRVIHGYDIVDDEIIWVAVEKRVPELLDKLQKWLDEQSK